MATIKAFNPVTGKSFDVSASEFESTYKPLGWTTTQQTVAPTVQTPNKDLYIGATNWANLQKQYTPYQLEQATTRQDGNIYWNPNVSISSIPSSAQTITPQSPALPTVPTTLSSNDITGATPIIKPAVPEPTSVPSLMAGLDTSNKGIQSQLEVMTTPLPEQAKVTELQKRQADYTEEKKTAQRDLQESTWEKYGLNTNVEQVQQIMPQIARVTAEFNSLQEQNANQPISSRIIGGTQDRLLRQKAIEVAGLSAVAQAYQGNVDMARGIASDAINAQYQDQANYYKSLNDQISNAYSDLNTAEKKKADQLTLVNNERLRLIEEEKERTINISNIAIDAAQNGADQATVQKILKASDYMTAIKLASQFLTDGNWTESEITDANGNPMLFNESTGEYKTAVGTSTSDIYFTDANGDSWNIAGWATDQTKPQQMNAIAKRIGKVTDENIDEKVKEFTPGLTPEMVKEASAMSGVSWEAIMTMVNQEAQGGLSNVAKNNNNFGGLTFNNQEWIKPFGGVKGTDRPEGGNYIKFPTKQEGLNAMAALMASYGKVDNTPKVANEITDLTKLVEDGKLTDKEALAQVSDKNKQGLINSLSSVVSISDTANDIVAKEKAQLATDLINHNGLNSAVGVIAAGRIPAPWNIGKKQDFIASVEQLVSGLSLDSLVAAKSRGATFGALSDSEMRILASAATKIGTWRKLDKNGNVVGYKASENAFKKELENINQILLRGVKSNIESGGSDPLGLGVSNSNNPLGL